jgi:predicted aminopeptidase
MDIIKKLLLALVGLTLLSACQMGYYFSSAYNQVSLLSSRVPIDKAMKDPNLTEDEKRKLLLAQKVREFAEKDLHLKDTENYTSYVKLDRPYVTYVVSAAPKWELTHHLWKYPFVGQMPYKGFFNEKDAKEEEQELKKENLDTYYRGVSAYSTLGWFRDPILSSMLRYPDYELVNTLIHETVHATIFIKSSADFNERLAVYLGNKGMELFYLKEEGPDSKTLKRVRDENEDDHLFSQFISHEIDLLAQWYKDQKDQNEDARKTRLKEIQARFEKEVEPHLKTNSYAKFKNTELNNARLMLYKTYMQDLSDFDTLYMISGANFSHFIQLCRKLEEHPKPEQGVKDLITSLQLPAAEAKGPESSSPEKRAKF